MKIKEYSVRILVCLTLLWLQSGWLFCQDIKGFVSCLGKPVPYVNVLLKDTTAQHKLLQFTTTNEFGEFTIRPKSNLTSFILDFTSISFNTKRVFINDIYSLPDNNFLKIELTERITKLQEVTIKSDKSPIKVIGDTTKYDLVKFIDGSEQVVEDILKKLPGVEVSENGIIKFKGRAISRLLLEGDDLFGHNYSIGSKNIRADNIESVEGISGFYENPMFKDVKDSDDVVINLKLKRGESDFSGSLSVGLGVGNEPRYNTGATVLGLTKSYKGFAILKSNNIGKNFSPYDVLSTTLTQESFNDASYFTDKYISEGIFDSNLSTDYSKVSRNFYTGINSLFKIGKNTTLKLNSGLFEENLFRINNFDSFYNFGTEELRVFQDEVLEKTFNIIDNSANLITQLSKNSRVEFTYKIEIKDTNFESESMNNDLFIRSRTLSEDFFHKAKLTYTQRLSSTSLLDFNVIYASNSSPQKLNLDPGFDYSQELYNESVKTLQQNTSGKEFLSIIGDFVKKINRIDINVQSGIKSIANQARTNTYNNHFDTSYFVFSNKMKYDLHMLYSKGSSRILLGGFTFKPSLEIRRYNNLLVDNVQNQKFRISDFYLLPAINLSYKINDVSFIYLDYLLKQDEPSTRNLLSQYHLSSYRTTINSEVNLQLQRNNNLTFGYNINDLYNLFTFNVNATYTHYDRSYLSENQVTELHSYVSNFLSSRGEKFFNFSLAASKFLSPLKTTVKLRSNYNLSVYNNTVNGSLNRKIESHNLNSSVHIRTGFNSFFNFENVSGISRSWFSLFGLNGSNVTGLENKFHIVANSKGRLKMKCSLFYLNPSINQALGSYTFLDLGLHYKVPRSRMVFELIGHNLSNNKLYSVYSISDFYSTRRSINVLDRYVMIIFSIGL